MFYDNEQTITSFGLFMADVWKHIWPEYIIPIFAVAILLSWLWGALRLKYKGANAFKGSSFSSFVLKTAGSLAVLPLLAVIILVSVQYFGKERVAQHHDQWAWQIAEAPKMLEGVLFGEVPPDSAVVAAVDSSAADYYVLGPDEEIPEGYTRESWQEYVNRPIGTTPAVGQVRHEFGQSHTQPRRGFKVKNIGPPPPPLNVGLIFVGPSSSGGTTSSLAGISVQADKKMNKFQHFWFTPYLWFAVIILIGLFVFWKIMAFHKSGGQLKADSFIKVWPYAFNAIFVVLMAYLSWPRAESMNISALQKMAMLVMLLLGNVWFFYVSRRTFYNQHTESQQKHLPSILATAPMSLGLLFLPLISILKPLFGITVLLALLLAVNWLWKSGWPMFKKLPAKSMQYWVALVVALVIVLILGTGIFWVGGLLFRLSTLMTICWIIWMGSSYILSCFHSIQAREILLPFVFGDPVNWRRSVIFRQSHRWQFIDEYRKERLRAKEEGRSFKDYQDPESDTADGYGTSGAFINLLSPALPFFSFKLLPFEQKEQMVRLTYTQVRRKGKKGAGSGIQDVLRIVGITCFDAKHYWGLGDDERMILVQDAVIDEEEGDKGNLGVALRAAKVRRRRKLASMDVDEALESKTLFGKVSEIDETPEAKEKLLKLQKEEFLELQTEVRFNSGFYPEIVEITDVNPEPNVRQSLEARDQADIDAESTVVERRAKGEGAAAEMKAIAKGKKDNPEGEEFTLKRIEAENISLAAIIRSIFNRSSS